MKYDIKLGTRVMMGIPTMKDSPRRPAWVDGMAGLQMPLGSSLARKWTWDEPIADARNNLCKTALDLGVQYLMFLGDDVIPPMNALMTLLDKIGREFPVRGGGSARASMITGIYWTKTYPCEPYIFRNGENGLLSGTYKNWLAGEFFDIDVAGVDCLLLETEVLKKMEFPWFSTDWAWDEGQVPSSIATEDYYFYTKARDLGFRLFADTSIQCFHEDRTTGAWFGLTMDMPQAGGKPEVGEGEVLVADLGAGLATHTSLFGPKTKIMRFDMREDVKPDVRCDIRQIDERWYGQFDWVNASHVLEHFRRSEAMNLVNHWIKLLKPGGTITIHVPNVERAMRVVLGDVEESGEGRRYAWAQLYGDQAESGAPWQHLNGFTKRKLEGLLQYVPDLESCEVVEEDEGLNLKATGRLKKAPEYYTLTKVWKRIAGTENDHNPTENGGSATATPTNDMVSSSPREGEGMEEVKEVADSV